MNRPDKRKRLPSSELAGPKRLSLAPLSLDEALRGAAATGVPPEGPKRKPKVKAKVGPAAGAEKASK